MWIKAAAAVLAAAMVSVSTAGGQASETPDLAVIPPRGVSYTTAEAVSGMLSRKASFGAGVVFPVYDILRAPQDGIVSGVSANNGDYVEDGAVLAEFTVEKNAVVISELQLDYDIAASRLESELDSLNDALAAEEKKLAELAHSLTTENAIRTQEIKVARARENRDYAKYSGERSLAAKQKNLIKLTEESADYSITAEEGGYVMNMPYLPIGGKVARGDIIANVVDMSSYYLVVTDGSLEHLKCGAAVAVSVRGRDIKPVSGIVVSNTTLIDPRESDVRRVIIELDDPVSFMAEIVALGISPLRQSYSVETALPTSEKAVLVPRGAVKQEASRHYINILEDGLPKKRYVLTGMSDSAQTQILEGLEDGTLVILD